MNKNDLIMNKDDLIKSIANSAKISKTSAAAGLNGLLSTLRSAMQNGKQVRLLGFGSFSVVERASRIGRNPKTGEVVPIPPCRVVRFRPGKELALKRK